MQSITFVKIHFPSATWEGGFVTKKIPSHTSNLLIVWLKRVFKEPISPAIKRVSKITLEVDFR